MMKLLKSNANYFALFLLLIAGISLLVAPKNVSAQESQSVLYVPLVGITSIPEPLALPRGPGNVTYNYAVKNFLQEIPLDAIKVTDDKCSPVEFTEGDDNGDKKLDFSETWRYKCKIKLSETTQSIATAIGTANNLPAAHKAYATVVVGSENAPPLVNIVNITKVAYPLKLPAEGGDITFTYRVNNPGEVPLSEVSVTDDKCKGMSKKVGDTNANNLLDITEVWVYNCTTHLTRTTTNTATVTSFANGLKAVGYVTLTVTVEGSPIAESNPGFPTQPIHPDVPGLPQAGLNPELNKGVWGVLGVILVALGLIYILMRKSKLGKTKRRHKFLRRR